MGWAPPCCCHASLWCGRACLPSRRAPPPLPSSPLCRRVIVEAGATGSFSSTVQFPLDSSPAGNIAAAGAASLAQPEAAALLLPHASAPGPALATPAPKGTAAAPEASTLAAEAAPASDAAGAGQDETAAFLAAQEAQEAPLAAPPSAANISSPAGDGCSTTLELLDHPSYSIFRSLVATAGERSLVCMQRCFIARCGGRFDSCHCRPPLQAWRAP